jgi:hypothetical protein
LLPQLPTKNVDIKGAEMLESTLEHHLPLSPHFSLKTRTIATFCRCHFDSTSINTVATIHTITTTMILVTGPIYNEIIFWAYTATVTTFVNICQLKARSYIAIFEAATIIQHPLPL